MTPTPVPMDIGGAITVLTEVGVFPVIAIVATLGLATYIYKHFRK